MRRQISFSHSYSAMPATSGGGATSVRRLDLASGAYGPASAPPLDLYVGLWLILAVVRSGALTFPRACGQGAQGNRCRFTARRSKSEAETWATRR